MGRTKYFWRGKLTSGGKIVGHYEQWATDRESAEREAKKRHPDVHIGVARRRKNKK